MHTFKEAAISYIENGGEERYLSPIIEYFGDIDLTTIAPFDVKKMALELYPKHSNSTRNRQALTPARAVLNHGYDRGWCQLIRIKRLKTDKVEHKPPANSMWTFSFIRQCERDGLDHLAALVLFMQQTAARVSEAVALQWDEVDLTNRKVTLLKTKTDVMSTRHLTDELISRISKLPQTDGPVFKYTSRFSVNERIIKVCERAEIPYKSSHIVGRHSFATMLVAGGVDIKTAMDAGGWKSSKIFLEIYVHSQNASKNVADKLNSLRFDSF